MIHQSAVWNPTLDLFRADLTTTEHQNLSRSSTLVSLGETEGYKPDPTFHSSFLSKFAPNSKHFQEKDFVDINISEAKRQPDKASAHSHLSRFLVNGWIWELFSWCISAICILTIAIILGLYDGRRVPRWPLGITLNAYISVLSAVAKYALAVPVDEALGQLRWLYFTSGPKKLIDFELFDDATRGPWGALALLVSTRARTLASLGASITLLSLALDPFFQQLVTYPQRASTSDRSRILRSVSFSTTSSRWSDVNHTEELGPDVLMASVVDRFVISSGPFAVPEITPFCASDDCTWPVFDTLGFCNECKDISSMLQFACLEENGQWASDWTPSMELEPNSAITSCGYFFNATSSKPMLMSGYATNSTSNRTVMGEALTVRQLSLRDPRTEQSYWNRSINFQHVPTPITNFISVAVQEASDAYLNKTPIAHECVIRYCTKTILAQYSKGNYSERILSTFTNDTMTPFPLQMEVFPDGMDYEYLQNITIKPPGQDRIFTVDNETALQTLFKFDLLIPFYVTQANLSAIPEIRSHNDRNDTSDGEQILEYPINYWANSNMTAFLGNLTTAMTNVIRQYPTSSEPVFGSGSFEIYVHITWAWFALPVSLLVLTSGFLATTIFRSQKHLIWKTSSLAVLAHGLDHVAKADIDSRSLSELFDKACDTEVTLKVEKGARRLYAV